MKLFVRTTLSALALSVSALSLGMSSPSALAHSDTVEMNKTAESSPLLAIQQRWAQANYQIEDEAQKMAAFEDLIQDASALTEASPNNADYWIWLGISKSTYAGVKGGLGALGFAKEARDSLKKALEIDPTALNGSAYTSLGILFHKVPGWPIGFGSDKTAEKLLKKALAVNPEGIDPNYFYAEFLFNDGEYQKAKMHLEKAQNAAPRPNRPLADAGRHQEIDTLMQKVNKKLKR